MQLGEAINAALFFMEKEEDPKCNKKDEYPKWRSRVNNFNSQEPCTGTRLYDNMDKARKTHEGKGLGVVPVKTPKSSWSLSKVSKKSFPVQAHHLIPKNYLPKHQVCRWLAVKYKKDAEYQLKFDSKYDTDHANNGYCMPYASPLKEWKRGKKVAIAFEVMKKTGVQLHHGSHATVLDVKKLKELAGKSIVPEIEERVGGAGSDEVEQDGVERPGYLNRVHLLLDIVDSKSIAHVERCKECKKKENGKRSVLPTEGVVVLMNQVSKVLKILIQANVVHVSGYAYYYACAKGHVVIRDGEVFISESQANVLEKELDFG